MRKWIVEIYHFLFPILVAALYILLLYILFPSSIFYRVGGILVLYLIPPAGKESMVPAAVYLLKDVYGMDSIFIASALISLVDILVAWWVSWNWELVKKIPLIGTYISRIEKIGKKKWREHRIMRKFVYLGLAAFVAIPFQGSGGLTATVIGRILGLEKYKVLFSIAMGAIVGCMFIAVGAYFAIFTLGKGGFLALGGIIIFIVVIGVIYKWLKGEEE